MTEQINDQATGDQAVMSKTDYESLELKIRKEQSELRKELPKKLIDKIVDIVDGCMLMPKGKQANFITREKLTYNLLRAFKESKEVNTTVNYFNLLEYGAVFIKNTKDIARLDFVDKNMKEIVYTTYYNHVNKLGPERAHYRDVILFDFNSIYLEKYHHDYIQNNKNGLGYSEMSVFLASIGECSSKDEIRKVLKIDKQTASEESKYGTVTKIEDHPIMKKVIEEYQIPTEVINKPKRKLQMLDTKTLAVVREFDSMNDAQAETGIRSNTIANVVCEGESAKNYMDAGGYKWQWSNKPNGKYDKLRA